MMRWQGHSIWQADSFANGQPNFGPGPYGAIGWYCLFHDSGSMINFFDPEFNRSAQKTMYLEFHRQYQFKFKVITMQSGKSRYFMKVWKMELPEPDDWDLITNGHDRGLSRGSCMLVAHQVAASFGKITIH